MRFVVSKCLSGLNKIIILDNYKGYTRKNTIYLTNKELYDKKAIEDNLYFMTNIDNKRCKYIANEIYTYL